MVTWSTFGQGLNDRKIYLDPVGGSDSNSGLSNAAPRKTWDAAYSLVRDGYADWLLLKRGTTLQVNDLTMYLRHSGRSESERMVVGAYGSGARPKIQMTTANIYERPIQMYAPSGTTRGNIALLDLEITNSAFDGNVDDCKVMEFICEGGGKIQNVTVEGCWIHNFNYGPVFQGANWTYKVSNVKFRNNVISDFYTEMTDVGTNNSVVGMYAYFTDGLLIEDNYWLNIARDTTQASHYVTVYHHVYYAAAQTQNVICRNNVHLEVCDLEFRGNSNSISDNLIVQPTIGIQISDGFDDDAVPNGGCSGLITDNVILDADLGNDGSGGIGMQLANVGSTTPGMTVSGNIISGKDDAADGEPFQIVSSRHFGLHNLILDGNIVYGFNGNSTVYSGGTVAGLQIKNNQLQQAARAGSAPSVFNIQFASTVMSDGSGNTFYCPDTEAQWFELNGSPGAVSDWNTYSGGTSTASEVSYTDAARNHRTYYDEVIAGHARGTADNADVIAAMKAQSRDSWDDRLEATAINTYIRAGFDVAGVVDPTTEFSCIVNNYASSGYKKHALLSVPKAKAISQELGNVIRLEVSDSLVGYGYKCWDDGSDYLYSLLYMSGEGEPYTTIEDWPSGKTTMVVLPETTQTMPSWAYHPGFASQNCNDPSIDWNVDFLPRIKLFLDQTSYNSGIATHIIDFRQLVPSNGANLEVLNESGTMRLYKMRKTVGDGHHIEFYIRMFNNNQFGDWWVSYIWSTTNDQSVSTPFWKLALEFKQPIHSYEATPLGWASSSSGGNYYIWYDFHTREHSSWNDRIRTFSDLSLRGIVFATTGEGDDTDSWTAMTASADSQLECFLTRASMDGNWQAFGKVPVTPTDSSITYDVSAQKPYFGYNSGTKSASRGAPAQWIQQVTAGAGGNPGGFGAAVGGEIFDEEATLKQMFIALTDKAARSYHYRWNNGEHWDPWTHTAANGYPGTNTFLEHAAKYYYPSTSTFAAWNWNGKTDPTLNVGPDARTVASDAHVHANTEAAYYQLTKDPLVGRWLVDYMAVCERWARNTNIDNRIGSGTGGASGPWDGLGNLDANRGPGRTLVALAQGYRVLGRDFQNKMLESIRKVSQNIVARMGYRYIVPTATTDCLWHAGYFANIVNDPLDTFQWSHQPTFEAWFVAGAYIASKILRENGEGALANQLDAAWQTVATTIVKWGYYIEYGTNLKVPAYAITTKDNNSTPYLQTETTNPLYAAFTQALGWSEAERTSVDATDIVNGIFRKPSSSNNPEWCALGVKIAIQYHPNAATVTAAQTLWDNILAYAGGAIGTYDFACHTAV